jgi:hypothetical protein
MLYNSLSSHLNPMTRFPLSMATRIADRQTVWISAADNAKNADGRPSQFVHWGVSTAIIAGTYSDSYAASVTTPSFD